MVKTYQFPSKYEYGAAIKIAPVTNEIATNVDTCLEANGTSDEGVKVQSVLPDLTDFLVINFIHF